MYVLQGGLKILMDGNDSVLSYPFIIQMFVAVIYGASDSDFESYNDGCTADDKTNVVAHYKF